VCHGRLGNKEQRHHALEQCIALSVRQQAWGQAANAMSGLIEEQLNRGDVQQAKQGLMLAMQYANLHPFSESFVHAEMRTLSAQLASSEGRHEEAIYDLEQVIAEYQHHQQWWQVRRRLIQLCEIQERADLVHAANATLKRLRLIEERLHTEGHARALAKSNAALQTSLHEVKRLQAQLLRTANLESLRKLVAGLAHELNTPLGVAILSLSTVDADLNRANRMVASGVVRRSELEALLSSSVQGIQLVERNLTRLTTLIATLRRLRQESSGHPSTVNLNSLAQSLWRAHSNGPIEFVNLLDRGLSIETHYDELSGVLAQLFENVIRHAFRNGEAGHLWLRSELAPGLVRLVLNDDGQGIDPMAIDKAFEPYESTSFGQGRSGLGLFLCYITVTQHLRGQISMTNLRDGGLQVVIELPQ
jgi:signal transduction histidine kinase